MVSRTLDNRCCSQFCGALHPLVCSVGVVLCACGGHVHFNDGLWTYIRRPRLTVFLLFHYYHDFRNGRIQ